MDAERIVSSIILLLAVTGIAWIIVGAIHRALSDCHEDCLDTWQMCECGTNHHLWAGQDKPDVYQCPICNCLMIAWIDNNGRIQHKMSETQL